jgi:hypothetical protein
VRRTLHLAPADLGSAELARKLLAALGGGNSST